MKDAIAEYGFDCRIRKLSPKTIDCYTKQLRYFQEYLEQNHAVTYLEQVKKAHIKSFLAMMDSKNRKPQYGLEIQRAAGRRKDYRLLKGKDELNLMEIKILINLVQSSRLLPQSSSEKLIRKLEKLCSIHERKKLKSQVTIINRNRAQNTQTIYAMDTIHEAIESDYQLRFHYFQYDTKKRQILTKNGREYRVSPYALIYHEDVYYYFHHFHFFCCC